MVPLPFLAFSTMPSLIQINYSWGFAAARALPFLHPDVLGKTLHFSMGLLTVAAIYGFAKPRWGRQTGLLAALLFFAIPVVTMNAWTSGEISGSAGGLIRWPVRLLVPVGFFLLSAQGLSELIKRIAFLRGHIPDPVEKHRDPGLDIVLDVEKEARK